MTALAHPPSAPRLWNCCPLLPSSGEGVWRVSEAVNTSRGFHLIQGLDPGAVYTLRLIATHLFDNASVFEDVIQTRVPGEAPRCANR